MAIEQMEPGYADRSMLERIAAAIYEEYRTRALKYGLAVVSDVPWSALPDSQKDHYRATGKAVMVTLRDIDEGFCGLPVLVAGKKALYSCAEDPELEDARGCWHTMIDTILKDAA